jgi:hypothetical protein
MKRIACVIISVVAVGCGSSSPTAPAVATPPPVVVPACQSQNTGSVYFQNRSTSSLTYDVIWDGAKLTTLGPNADSQIYVFAANIQHSLVFRFTNTSTLACNASTPVLTTCGATFYGCSG